MELDFSRISEQLLTLLTDPTSNLTAAFVLYAGIAIILLIFLAIATLFLMSAPEDEEVQSQPEAGAAATAPAAPAPVRTAQPKRARRPRTLRGFLTGGVLALFVFAAVWLTTGYTTADKAVCSSCHGEAPHGEAITADVHQSVACATCHDAGTLAGRMTTAVPGRLLHFVDSALESTVAPDYGRVSQGACRSCHNTDIAETTTDEVRGVKMSHREPLAASADCGDCHGLRDGIVGAYDQGMRPCLRCHDSKIASAKCDSCHVKNTAAAARSRSGEFATQQIKTVDCGGCHDQKRECDTCHGTRMPHSRYFMAQNHARAAAVDFWYNGGRGCSKCHTQQRRPCTKCHGFGLGRGHGPSNAVTHRNAESVACNGCHQKWAPTANRDFCVDVCHTPEARAESPR